MNELEVYIKEVVSVEDISAEWVSWGETIEEPMYCVTVMGDCYGRVSKFENYWSKSKWEEIKKRGWFLAWF